MIPCAHVSSGTLRKVEKLTEEQVPSVVECFVACFFCGEVYTPEVLQFVCDH